MDVASAIPGMVAKGGRMRQVGFAGTIAVGWVLAAGGMAPQAAARPGATIDGWIATFTTWAEAPAIVNAVKAANAGVPPAYAAMSEERWASLSVLDPLVRDFTHNEAAAFLKSNRTPEVAEAFVSAADGTKVAFLSKPTNWIHKGKPKHELPMSGSVYRGPIEVDKSTGVQQIQIGVPVRDGGKPIGSLVAGVSVAKLR
jgi:hypothetical protein